MMPARAAGWIVHPRRLHAFTTSRRVTAPAVDMVLLCVLGISREAEVGKGLKTIDRRKRISECFTEMEPGVALQMSIETR